MGNIYESRIIQLIVSAMCSPLSYTSYLLIDRELRQHAHTVAEHIKLGGVNVDADDEEDYCPAHVFVVARVRFRG